jgi:glucosyl-3-phosphoglycerate synthase
MADFSQTGVVTTLHRLKTNSVERIELDLERFSRTSPIGLVLPALYSEFETPAMQGIVPELRKVKYLERIIVAVGKASREQYQRARSFFSNFYTPVTCLWVESPRITDLLKLLEER